MARVGFRKRYAYRKDATRLKLSTKAAAIVLLVNILLVIMFGSMVLLHFEKHKNPRVNTYGDAVWLTWVTITTRRDAHFVFFSQIREEGAGCPD